MKAKIAVGEWFCLATDGLRKVGIDSARLDSLILLEDATKLERSYLLAHPEIILGGKKLAVLNTGLQRRVNREPLAYIRGFCEFYGRRFAVNNNVLIPRPESEAIIELLAKVKPKKGQMLLDIGSGSGILAITTKLEYPILEVTAMDISAPALKVAKNNAKKLGANIKFLRADFTTGIPKADIILANLPYLPNGFTVSAEVNFEPSVALYAATNGLGLIGQLAPLARKALNIGGNILLESMPSQHQRAKNIYEKAGFKLTATCGYIQCFNKS